MNTEAAYSHAEHRADAPAVRPLISEIRMSRLRHPRASILAMVLLAVVFLAFGLIASALEPGYSPAPSTAEGLAMIIGNALLAL